MKVGKNTWIIGLMCLIVLLSRLPWIGTSYGTDPDSYRVILAARSIAENSEYTASRLPGNPVYEYMTAFTPGKYHPVISNGITALFSVISFLLLVLILRKLNIKYHYALAICYAFTPVIYINSVVTMGYITAFTFISASLYLGLINRPISAGILLGMATGTRITSLLFMIPISLTAFKEKETILPKKFLFLFILSSIAVSMICFIPVFTKYGLDFITYYNSSTYPDITTLIKISTINVWGKTGTIGILIAVTIAIMNLKKLQQRVKETESVVWFMILLPILMYTVLFIFLPHETEYLIPIVPFVIILMGLTIKGRLIYVPISLIIISSFIDINRGGINFNGPMVEYFNKQEMQNKEIKKLEQTVSNLPINSVIVAGWKLPKIKVDLKNSVQKKHSFIYLINNETELHNYANKNVSIYYLSRMNEFNKNVYDIDLKKVNAHEIELR